MPQEPPELRLMFGQIKVLAFRKDLHGLQHVLLAQMLRVEQNKHQRVLRVARALRHDICALLNVPLQDLYVQRALLAEHGSELVVQIIGCEPRSVFALPCAKLRPARCHMTRIAALDSVPQVHDDWRGRSKADLAITNWTPLKH